MSDIVERLGGPHEWGYRDVTDGTFIPDNAPFEAADEIERLRALVKDLADDLEAELNGRYPPEVRAYPSERRRYERDMTNVYEARRALEPRIFKE